MAEKNYDSTIMRIAGNLLSGQPGLDLTTGGHRQSVYEGMAAEAVRLARAIVGDVLRSHAPTRSCFVCQTCGPCAVDEDGCCRTCGADAPVQAPAPVAPEEAREP